MAAYDRIAALYDLFNSFDYKGYVEYIKKKAGITFGDKTAVDCGCGTGSLLQVLAAEGLDCTGVDISADMLAEASGKPGLESTRLILQSLPELDLYRAYDYVFCCLDTVNHMTDLKQLGMFFSRAYNFTEKNGLLIFDTKTEAEFKRSSRPSCYCEEDVYLFYSGKYIKPYMKTKLSFHRGSEQFTNEITERFYTNREIAAVISHVPYSFVTRFSYGRGERTVFVYRKD